LKSLKNGLKKKKSQSKKTPKPFLRKMLQKINQLELMPPPMHNKTLKWKTNQLRLKQPHNKNLRSKRKRRRQPPLFIMTLRLILFHLLPENNIRTWRTNSSQMTRTF